MSSIFFLPLYLFFLRRAEGDQAGHLQPQVRAAGGESTEHGDAGRTAEETGRDQHTFVVLWPSDFRL